MPSPSLYRCTSKSTVLGFTFILRYISLSRLYTFSLSFSDIQFPFIRNFSLDKTREGFVISKPVCGDCFFLSLSLSLSFPFFFISAHSSSRNRSLFFFFLSLAFSRLLHVALYFSRRRGRRKEEKEKERAKRSDIREAIRTTHRCGGRRRQRRLDAVCLNTAEFRTCWNGEEIFSGAFQP